MIARRAPSALRIVKPRAGISLVIGHPRGLVTSNAAPRSGQSSTCSSASRFGLFAAGGTGVALYSLWWAGRPSSQIHAEAPSSDAALVAQPNGQVEEEHHIDASTKMALPKRLPAPVCLGGDPKSSSSDKPFVLLASGVRTVSFLRVQVYVVALYVDEAAYKKHTSSPTSKKAAEEGSTQAFISHLLSSGEVPCILRVAPTRNTDFGHLRDGFGRAVQARVKVVRKALQQAQKDGAGGLEGAAAEFASSLLPSEEEEQALADGMQALRECFPKASLQKGQTLDLVFHPSPREGGVDLTLEHDGAIMGSLKHDGRAKQVLDVAKLLMEAYVAEKDPVSGVFKQALSEKLFSSTS